MVDVPSPGLWAEPKVWIAIAGILVLLAIIMVYYEIAAAEKGA